MMVQPRATDLKNPPRRALHIEWAAGAWFRLRHSRLVDNVVALYVLHFANYLLPLITVPYTVRVLTPSGYGLGAFAVSFASVFGTILDYGFNLSASRAVSVNRSNRHAVSRIAAQVMFTKAVLLANCAGVFWLLTWVVRKLQGNSLVMWIGFLQVAIVSLTPFWLYQGLEELRFSSRVNLAARVAYVPALFLFVRRPADTWKWMLLQAIAAGIPAAILWVNAGLRLGVGWMRPRLTDLETQLRAGFSLFVSQAAVTAYTSGNTFILGMFTNMTMAGYYSAAEKVVLMVLGLLGPVTQAVYPRATQLAASSREAALRLSHKMLIFMGTVGFGMSASILVAAPWFVPILLGARFLPSITMMQILSPLPFLIALSNVLGIQVMIPFKHDVAFTVILVTAGLFNLGMASLLAPLWQGNGMAFSVMCSELLVTAAMFWYLGRQRLSPLIRVEPEAVHV
jgi:PST family polysaccharide transporter